MLEVDQLSVDLGGRRILSDVSFSIEAEQRAVLLGPNGSGKTTLLRALIRAVPIAGGFVRLEGQPLETFERRSLARRVAVLRQETHVSFEFTVEELVEMGRSPHKTLLEGDDAEDRRVIDEVLEIADATRLRARLFNTLSGGEKQRVLLARALAQKPRLLLLDEPTNHLDIQHQLDLVHRIRGLGITVLAAFHDLSLALRFADRALLLVDGRLIADGPAEEVIAPEPIQKAFGVEVERLEGAHGAVLSFQRS